MQGQSGTAITLDSFGGRLDPTPAGATLGVHNLANLFEGCVYSKKAQLNEVKGKHKIRGTVDPLNLEQAGFLGMVTGRGFGFRGSR